MSVLDCQLHIWEHPTNRAWDPDYPNLELYPAFTAELALQMLSENHVAGALIDVLPAHRSKLDDGTWEYDISYFREHAARTPGVFAATLRIDPDRADLEDVIATASADPQILALRLVLRFPWQIEAYHAGAFHPLLATASRYRLPVMLFATGHLDVASQIARSWPDNWLLIDHLGMPQAPRPVDDPPFSQLESLLSLSEYPNIGVKCIGLPDFSKNQFPYSDTFDAFRRIVDSFGIAKLMWGSDFTRLRHRFEYSDLLSSIRDHAGLNSRESESFFGGSLKAILGWPAVSVDQLDVPSLTPIPRERI